MLNQPMVEKLLAMRLLGMVEALKAQEQDRSVNELSFLERLSLLVDQQSSWRENQSLTRTTEAGFSGLLQLTPHIRLLIVISPGVRRGFCTPRPCI